MSETDSKGIWEMARSLTSLGSIFALSMAATPSSAASYASTYMAIDEECQVSDDGHDAFSFSCIGPSGIHAVLIYIEGQALISYEVATGSRVLVPFMVGGEDRVFGKLVEWRSRDGSPPCAAIIRTATMVGSRLAVVALDDRAPAPTMTVMNDDAHRAADALCEGLAPERTGWEPISKAEMMPEFVGTYAPSGECDGDELVSLSMTGMRHVFGPNVMQFEGLDVSYSFAGDPNVVTIFLRDESVDRYPLALTLNTESPQFSLELSQGLGDRYRFQLFGDARMMKC